MLAGAAGAAGVVTFLLASPVYRHLPALPRGGAVSLLLLALAELTLTSSVRGRLAGRPGTRPILPLVVARYAVLARASSLMGALVFGLWLGVATFVGLYRRDYPGTATPDLQTAALHVAAAVLLVVVALRLERACRVPPPPPSADA